MFACMQSAETIFKWYQEDPEKLEGFRTSIISMAKPRIGLMPCMDPSVAAEPGAHIVDVGGGVGHLLAEMLRLRPQVPALAISFQTFFLH
jgi:2-polyprenyl-3-methyl-5-hydroxy-6-metoxy-1,4-benzoquinol methylase